MWPFKFTWGEHFFLLGRLYAEIWPNLFLSKIEDIYFSSLLMCFVAFTMLLLDLEL